MSGSVAAEPAERTVSQVDTVMGGLVAALAPVAVVVSSLSAMAAFALGLARGLGEIFFFQTVFFSIVLGGVGWAAGRRGTTHRAVWLPTVFSLTAAIEVASTVVAAALLADQPTLQAEFTAYRFAPADLPTAVSAIAMLESTWLWSLGGFLSLGLLYFPDGRLPSRRWRPVVVLASVSLAVYTVLTFWLSRPSSEVSSVTSMDPGGLYAIDPLIGFTMGAAIAGVGLAVLGSVASLFVRHRRADSEQRHQLRWMISGAGFIAVAFVLIYAVAFSTDIGDATEVLNVGTAVLIVPALVASYGVGILKYRLYDIDLVLNRSIVFGVLALFITGVYIAIVLGLGAVVGDQSNTWLSVAATALVAAAFEPVRARVQHLANVLVYGRRSTPYEVLAAMSHGMQPARDQAAEGARVLAAGIGAEAVAIWSVEDDRPLATWPEDHRPDGSWDLTVPLEVDGARVGDVRVRKRRGDPVSSHDERLVNDFAGNAALVLSNVGLNRRLTQRVDELARSRARLVSAQDEARRRLERDLHDGAQQELVALKVKLALAATLARSEGEDDVASMILGLSERADEAVQSLRDLARGIYPPMLESDGLEAAVLALSLKSRTAIVVRADHLGRFAREIETALYFCIVEALTLATESLDEVVVELERSSEDVVFSVTIPGDIAECPQVESISDRLSTLGGSLTIAPPSLTGRVPVGSSPPGEPDRGV